MTSAEARDIRRRMRHINEAREAVKQLPAYKKLYSKIPAQAGGGEVSPDPYDILYPQWLDIVEKRGRSFGRPVEVLGTAPLNGCHVGTMVTFVANPEKYLIATGFYAFRDRFWRRHSWLIKRQTGQAIETTKGRPLRYFGAILSPEESPRFVAMVLDGDLPLEHPMRATIQDQLTATRGSRYSYFRTRLA